LTFPFGVLDEMGSVAAVQTNRLGEDHLILWDRDKETAMAYRPNSSGMDLTFTVVQGQIVDEETESVWGVNGLATDGPLAGERLEAVPEAFIAFWFAWPTFYPDIEIWSVS
jgi:hypothetical protein